jgi:hypothetical protein
LVDGSLDRPQECGFSLHLVDRDSGPAAHERHGIATCHVENIEVVERGVAAPHRHLLLHAPDVVAGTFFAPFSRLGQIRVLEFPPIDAPLDSSYNRKN